MTVERRRMLDKFHDLSMTTEVSKYMPGGATISSTTVQLETVFLSVGTE